MNIQQAIQDLGQSFNTCLDKTQQGVFSLFGVMKDMRGKSEVFYKTIQLADASLNLVAACFPAVGSFDRLSKVFSSVVLHDFYRVIQRPRDLLFPISATLIDEKYACVDIAEALEDQPDVGGHPFELYDIAKKVLKEQLESMAASNSACSSTDALIDQLEERLKKLPAVDLEQGGQINLQNVSLAALKQSLKADKWIKEPTFLTKGMNYCWAATDVLATTCCLDAWNIVSASKIADSIGLYRVFPSTKEHKLETWLIGAVCVSLALKLVESARVLHDEVLTPDERFAKQWDAVTSAADLVLFGAIFLNMVEKVRTHHTIILCLTIVAKTLGIVSIMKRPQPQFFE